MRTAPLLRSLLILVAGFMVVACQNCDSKCKGGVTFYVADLAGSLGRGGSEPLHVCFDQRCQDLTITRANAGGSVFLPFKGVGDHVSHTITVTGVGTLKGEYSGKIDSYTQDPGGDCAACDLATIKIGSDGTLTPAVVATPATTAAGG